MKSLLKFSKKIWNLKSRIIGLMFRVEMMFENNFK